MARDTGFNHKLLVITGFSCFGQDVGRTALLSEKNFQGIFAHSIDQISLYGVIETRQKDREMHASHKDE